MRATPRWRAAWPTSSTPWWSRPAPARRAAWVPTAMARAWPRAAWSMRSTTSRRPRRPCSTAVRLRCPRPARTSWSSVAVTRATTAWAPRCARAPRVCGSSSSCRARPRSAWPPTAGRSGPTSRRPTTARSRPSTSWAARCASGVSTRLRCSLTRRVPCAACAWPTSTGATASRSVWRAASARFPRSSCSSRAASRAPSTASSTRLASRWPSRAARCRSWRRARRTVRSRPRAPCSRRWCLPPATPATAPRSW